MYVFMIHLKQVEPGNHARIERPELGEVYHVFDLVVPVQMLKEMVQTRCKEPLKAGGIQTSFAVVRRRLGELAAFAPQRGMDIEPEGGELAEVAVSAPTRSGVKRT